MIFKVFWKNIEFLEVEKVNDIYYSRLIIENVNKVLDEGYPITFLKNIKVIDKKIPKLIENRIPSLEYIEGVVNKKDNIEDMIIDYIEKTNCKRVTDYLSINVEK